MALSSGRTFSPALYGLGRRQREIARIDAASERIAADEVGWCADCGEPIGVGRLAADPTTALCVGCAART